MRGTIRVAMATLAATAVVALTACSDDEPQRDQGGNVTAPAEEADVFSIEVGDCTGQVEDSTEVTTIDIVPCTDPHDQEAYASVTVADGEFPGEEALETQAQTDCTTEFETFVGMAYDGSALEFTWLQPTEESWAQNDREILCLIVDPAGPATGTLEGAKR